MLRDPENGEKEVPTDPGSRPLGDPGIPGTPF
jgi:hypothetical protein